MSSINLTVLMPVYNSAPFLREAIDSVLNQTWKNFELLIIDDGSTDESPNILSEFKVKDVRVRVESQKNSGLIKTLNRGLRLARGDWIARHDADDVSWPNRLMKQMEYLAGNPDCVLLGTSIEIISASGMPLRRVMVPTTHEQICESFFSKNAFAHGSVIFNKSVALEAGGYRDIPEAQHIEDFDLWARIARKHRVANLSEILYIYRDHPGSISNLKAETQRRNTRDLTSRILREKWYRDYWAVNGYDRDYLFSIPDASTSDQRLTWNWVMDSHLRALTALLRGGEQSEAAQRVLRGVKRKGLEYFTGVGSALFKGFKRK